MNTFNQNHNLITKFGKASFIGINQLWDSLFESIVLNKYKETKVFFDDWKSLPLEILNTPPIIYQQEMFKEWIKRDKNSCFNWTISWIEKMIAEKKEKEAMIFLSSCCISIIGLNEKSSPLGNEDDVYYLLNKNNVGNNEKLISSLFFEANHRLRKVILKNKLLSENLTILPEWFQQTEWGHPQQLSFRSAVSLLIRCQDMNWWSKDFNGQSRADKVIEWASQSIKEVKKSSIWEKNTRWHDFELLISLFNEDWSDYKKNNQLIERKTEKAFKVSM